MFFTMYTVLRHDVPAHVNMPAIGTKGRRKGRAMTKLDVYITEECWACDEARRIVADLAPQFPNIDIELRDVHDERPPSTVFATPTYILDGRTIFLGNPTLEELSQKLEVISQTSSE